MIFLDDKPEASPGSDFLVIKASSSIGRASVSKTEGWGFDALLACHLFTRLELSYLSYTN